MERAQVHVSPGELWETVGTFGGVGYWHPSVTSVDCDGEGPGALRRVETENGTLQVERLEEVDPLRHLLRYSMQETPLPVDRWTAELRVDDAPGMRGSLLTWSAHFDVRPGPEAPRVVGVIRRFMRAGLENLQAGVQS